MLQQQLTDMNEIMFQAGPPPHDQYIFKEDNVYSVYITRPIVAPHRYTELFELLKNASREDHVVFYLNTPGGRLDTTATIVSLMQICEAEITTQVVGPVCSAGTMIAVSGDNLHVAPHGYMMLHNASGGVGYDKINLTAQAAIHSAKWCADFMRSTYQHFLTEEEIDVLTANSDFYLDQEQCLLRWERVLEAREKDAEAADAQEEAEQQEHLERVLRPLINKIKVELLEELAPKEVENTVD